MMMNLPASDALALAERLRNLTADERGILVEFLLALEELDRRHLYLELGFDSLWKFCLEGLHLEEGQTNLRTRAVHLVRRFPRVADALREGRLSLSTLVRLGTVLTEENFDELLARAAFKTRAEVEHILVSLRPIEVKTEGFRKLPEPPPVTAAAPEAPTAVIAEPPPLRAPALQPVSASGILFRAVLTQSTVDRIERARELASHRIGPKDWDKLLYEMASDFVAKEEKRIAKKTDRPRKATRMPKGNRHIPAWIKRLVWQRDGGCCSWRGPDGHLCGSRWRLEFDHVDPVGRGGEPTVDSVRLLCSSHNQHHADNTYGREFMDRKRATTNTERGESTARTDAGIGLGLLGGGCADGGSACGEAVV